MYHVLEPEVVEHLSPQSYDAKLHMAALTLDVDDIVATVRRIRSELTA